MGKNLDFVDYEAVVKEQCYVRMCAVFGQPIRDLVKVKSWEISNKIGVVLQIDQPASKNMAYIWTPYPSVGETIPEIALQYAGESGRHSGTYPAAGLEKGKPALRLTITSCEELEHTIVYIKAMVAAHPLPDVLRTNSYNNEAVEEDFKKHIDNKLMPSVEAKKPKRQAIARDVQREVWQRDAGMCVECGSRELLCFDHIVPFSRGGGNTVRNIQLLCERCNTSKGNRL